MAKKALESFQANIRIPKDLLARIEAFRVPQESRWTPLTRSDRIVYVLGLGIEQVPHANGKGNGKARRAAKPARAARKPARARKASAPKGRKVAKPAAAE